MDILTFIVLLTFAVCIISGAARGFLRMLFSVLTLVVCLFVASHFSGQAENFLKENTNFYQTMNSSVYSTLSENADSAPETENPDSSDGTDGKNDQTLSDIAEVLASLPTAVIEGINQAVVSARDTVVTGIADAVTETLFSSIVRIGLFFITWLLMRLLYAALSVGLHNRAISGVNRTLGAVTGILEALLIVWLVLFAVTLGQNESSPLVMSITAHPLLKVLYASDPFLRTLT